MRSPNAHKCVFVDTANSTRVEMRALHDGQVRRAEIFDNAMLYIIVCGAVSLNTLIRINYSGL
jgi:hypothetical protein